MRDARILTWLLADAARAGHVADHQWPAILTIADAEGMAGVLHHHLAQQPLPDAARLALSQYEQEVPEDIETGTALSEAICCRAQTLFGKGDLDGGLRHLWQVNVRLRVGSADPGFWSGLLVVSQKRAVTPFVSRAIRLCYHLFETPVDPYLAWQGHRHDLFYVGRLLARDGKGRARARWLRLAFHARARWLARHDQR